MAAIVAVLTVCAAVAAAPAGAHACVTPAEIDVGTRATITVGVAAEAQPVVQVDVEVPDGFELDETQSTPGWDVERDGSTLRYRAGEIPAMQCGYVTVDGSATERRELVFTVVTTDVEGTTTEYGPDRLGAQIVYAGVEPSADDDAGDGIDPMLVAGIGLVAVGVAASVVVAVRRRRDAPVTTGWEPRRARMQRGPTPPRRGQQPRRPRRRRVPRTHRTPRR
jgi:hypothetical protein